MTVTLICFKKLFAYYLSIQKLFDNQVLLTLLSYWAKMVTGVKVSHVVYGNIPFNYTLHVLVSYYRSHLMNNFYPFLPKSFFNQYK